ncbi:MAG TPA: hypothetical protein VEH84_04615 [Alphaproteobacteria bacterium]|nr:hypothetical protein [Alphaproteobacteria bacterium]
MNALRLAALLVLIAGAARADAPEPVDHFRRYIGSAYHTAVLKGLVASQERSLAPACKNPVLKARLGQWPLRPVAFSADSAHPTAGVWQERLRVDRCGRLVLHNYLFEARPGLPPSALPLAPGRSQADARLQRDLMPALATAAAKNRPPCDDVRVTDTLLDAVSVPPEGDAAGRLLRGAWRESWSLDRCGAPLTLTVDFTADGSGRIAFDIR